MNRKIGYGAVTTNGLVTVDKDGRTARHFTGRVRVDYMCDNHFWVIIDHIEGFGDSIPTEPIKAQTIDTSLFVDKGIGDTVHVEEDCGEIWIPDHMVGSIRWFTRKW
jgi:hypothetical protein